MVWNLNWSDQMAMLNVARSQTLTEDIINQLLGLIRNGTWKAGESLPSERALMGHLGVSRPCLREALQALAALGVIEVRAGRRARVKGPTFQSIIDPARMAGLLRPDDLVQLWEVRVSLETAIARLAAERAHPDELSHLEEAILMMTLASQRDSLTGYVEADLDFHRCLADATCNPVFVEVYGVIHRMLRVSVHTTGAVPGGMDRGIRAHQGILEAVRARNAPAAEAVMLAHLGDSNRYRSAAAGLPADSTHLGAPVK